MMLFSFLSVVVTANTLFAVALAFLFAWGIYFLSGRFGSASLQKIVGVVAGVLWVIFALVQFGLIPRGGFVL